jgi:hypothetical protein
LVSSEFYNRVLDYYKWVITVSSFVITVSFGIAKLLPSNQIQPEVLETPYLFFIGWLFLFMAILLSCWKVMLITFYGAPLAPKKSRRLEMFLIMELDSDNLKFSLKGLIPELIFWLGLVFVFSGVLINAFQMISR